MEDARPAVRPPEPVAPSRFLRTYAWWAAGFALLLAALALALDRPLPDPGTPRDDVDVEAFVQPGCRHCEAARAWLDAERGRRPALTVVVHDVSRHRGALARLKAVAARAGVAAAATPALLVRGTLVVGWRDGTSPARVAALLDAPPRAAPAAGAADGDRCPVDLDEEPAAPVPGAAAPEAPCATAAPASAADETVDLPIVGAVSARDVGLPLFTVALGLVDGFNPCAMWVLLFLLSLLVNLRSRAKMFAIAGTFVVASGVCYFAFMAAWLTFFDLVGQARLVQVVLGAVACFVAAVHVKDFFAFHRGLTLSIPEGRKAGLYARVTAILRANRLGGAMAGVVVLAFLVNTVELLCTAGLPAVYTSVLVAYDLERWQHYAYLALYQVFYMLDDAIMLAVAIVTLSKRRLQERGGRWLKLVSGVVVAALGLLLLFRPSWLFW
ncbi:MAG: NrdH-redoxin [Planctomycetota bacterium]